MALNTEKMRERAGAIASSNSKWEKVDWWKFPVGDTLFYIAPAIDGADGVPWVNATYHYKVGPKKFSTLCLGPANEELFATPQFREFLDKRSVPLETGYCPVCAALAGELETSGDFEIEEMAAKAEAIFGIVPWASINRGAKTEIADTHKAAYPYKPSGTLFKKLWDAFANTGDISDPTQATLVRVARTGTGKKDTRYDFSLDTPTLRTPFALNKPQRAMLAHAQGPDGSINLFRVISNGVNTPEELEKALCGMATSRSDASPGVEGKLPCFGLECDPKDATCIECPDRVECAAICKVPVPSAMKPQPQQNVKPRQAAPAVVEEPDDAEIPIDDEPQIELPVATKAAPASQAPAPSAQPPRRVSPMPTARPLGGGPAPRPAAVLPRRQAPVAVVDDPTEVGAPGVDPAPMTSTAASTDAAYDDFERAMESRRAKKANA